MPGVVHSRTNTSALLKPIFDEDLQDAIQNETPFLKYAQKKDFPLDGSDFTIAVHLRRNANTQNTLITDDLPDSGQAKWEQGTIRAARVFQPFQIDNELIKLADRAAATFSERVEAIYDDAKSTLLKDGERQLLGDGSGVLCTAATVTGAGTATATVVVNTLVTANGAGVEDTRFLEEGEYVEAWAGNTQRVGQGSEAKMVVSSIDSDIQFKVQQATNPGTNTTSAALTTGDLFFKYGNVYNNGGTRTSKEVFGLGQIADDTGDFMGISATTYRRWRGTVMDAAGEPFGPGILGKAVIVARGKANMKDHPDVCYTHPAQTWALVYGAAGTFPDQRYSRDDVNKFGTTNKPVFNIDGRDVVLETCLDMQKSRVYLFKGAALLYGELQAPELEDFGDISILPSPGAAVGSVIAAQRGWLSWRFNMGCRRRNAFVLIKNMAVPAGF